MNLTWPVALAVLFGALLHAGWNAVVKSAADKAIELLREHQQRWLAAEVAPPTPPVSL